MCSGISCHTAQGLGFQVEGLGFVARGLEAVVWGLRFGICSGPGFPATSPKV